MSAWTLCFITFGVYLEPAHAALRLPKGISECQESVTTLSVKGENYKNTSRYIYIALLPKHFHNVNVRMKRIGFGIAIYS